MDPSTALATAISNSTKVTNSPFFSTIIDRIFGFKISEWNAQSEAIKRQILDSYEEAKQKGMGFQFISTFRENTNLLNTSIKATNYINPTKTTEIEFDNDVFWGLMQHSKQISQDEVQDLIAKIIAGEYNAPGTYSMSTLQIVKMLGKKEIELFEKMCSLLVNANQIPQSLFTLSEVNNNFLSQLRIDFRSLQTLQNLGLFLSNPMQKNMKNPNKKRIAISYMGKQLIFISDNENFIKVKFPDYYALSLVGMELIKHISPKMIDDYYSWLKKNYKISNYLLLP